MVFGSVFVFECRHSRLIQAGLETVGIHGSGIKEALEHGLLL